MAKVLTGLDQFGEKYRKSCHGQSLGLLTNQASVDHNLYNAKEVISTLLPGHLKVLFGPQHGLRGEDQDNMIETEDYFDPELHIPVCNLYGNKMDKLLTLLDTIDLLIIDLQDVGTRVYTFINTMLYCLKEIAKKGKRVLILDRPNPLGGITIEGHLLQPEFYSLVGPFSLPMRHGMTIGELAYLFVDFFNIEDEKDEKRCNHARVSHVPGNNEAAKLHKLLKNANVNNFLQPVFPGNFFNQMQVKQLVQMINSQRRTRKTKLPLNLSRTNKTV